MELHIDNVGKRYGQQHWAVKNISIRLKPGVVGLLGPNGAGKSSLMRMLATISRPTEGRVLWNGEDSARKPDRLRRALGYLPQDFGVYPNLNAVEFLSYAAALKGITGRSARRRIEELLELVNLTESSRRPIGGYSGGMRQRVGIAQALLNDPELLIVDEPTVGLDPEERIRFRNLLSDLSGERIVLFSTHIVSDIEAAATEIAVMHHGGLLSLDRPEEMIRGMENKVWEVEVTAGDMQEARQRWRISGSIRRADGMQLRVVAERPPVSGARPLAPTLEDAYLYLISSRAEEVSL